MTKDEDFKRFLNVTVAGKAANDPEGPDEENARKIFGPSWRDVVVQSERFNIDWKAHVNDLVQRLKSMENNIELDLGDFQRSLEPAWWPVVAQALDVGAVFEDERRALLGLMDAGMLTGQLQVRLTAMMGKLNDSVTGYITGSISYVLGDLLGKMTPDEANEKLLVPYNNIIQQRRAIYDMLGTASMAYGQRLYLAAEEEADKPQDPPPVH